MLSPKVWPIRCLVMIAMLLVMGTVGMAREPNRQRPPDDMKISFDNDGQVALPIVINGNHNRVKVIVRVTPMPRDGFANQQIADRNHHCVDTQLAHLETIRRWTMAHR